MPLRPQGRRWVPVCDGHLLHLSSSYCQLCQAMRTIFSRQPSTQGPPTYPKHLYVALISLVTLLVFVFSFLLISGLLTPSPFHERIWSYGQQDVSYSPPTGTDRSQRLPNQSFIPANYGLSGAHCEFHFPGYFEDISESVRHRRWNHITMKDLDIQGNNKNNTRVLIYNGDVSYTPLRSKTSSPADLSHESCTLSPTAVLRQTSGLWVFYMASIELLLPTLSPILCPT